MDSELQHLWDDTRVAREYISYERYRSLYFDYDTWSSGTTNIYQYKAKLIEL